MTAASQHLFLFEAWSRAAGTAEHHTDLSFESLSLPPLQNAPPAGNDLICVQSFDGQLSVFHQESFLFSSLLPGFLVPGPLAYCPQSDSIVTCNAAFELESFKFSTLAAASGGGGVRAPGEPAAAVSGSAAVAFSPARLATSRCCRDEAAAVRLHRS